MKNIVLFGAGKSASVLIRYLLQESVSNDWKIRIADADPNLIGEKTGGHPNAEAIGIDIQDGGKRAGLVSGADLVISMMPPSLHILIARDCIQYSKHLLTASYADDAIRALAPQAEAKNILFLCEMGLDPGIDHMSAMQLLDDIRDAGGNITCFKSHCGGLIAPESDDNPWHYKITWNPRNIVLAGKNGAVYRENGKEVSETYQQLFNQDRRVTTGNNEVPDLGYYPNRDSLPYIQLYGLDHAGTFIRTTLRYPAFMHGWNHVVALGLTDEGYRYDTAGKTLHEFFQEHFERTGAREYLEQELQLSFQPGFNMSENISHLANKPNPSLILDQLLYLGINDRETLLPRDTATAAEVLQFSLEKNLALHPGDKDLIVMLHEIEYTKQGKKYCLQSSLFVKGDDPVHTAMAKTVGLPLGIAAKLLLSGKLTVKGLHIPVSRDIYEPILEELQNHGIIFHETKREC